MLVLCNMAGTFVPGLSKNSDFIVIQGKSVFAAFALSAVPACESADFKSRVDYTISEDDARHTGVLQSFCAPYMIEWRFSVRLCVWNVQMRMVKLKSWIYVVHAD